MPLQASTPLIIDGVEYPYYAAHLSISPLWQEKSIGGSVNMRLIPYRLNESGVIESLPNEAKSVLFIDIFAEAQSDTQIASAVQTIMSGLQQFITDKQL
jgi:hypothetical protein